MFYGGGGCFKRGGETKQMKLTEEVLRYSVILGKYIFGLGSCIINFDSITSIFGCLKLSTLRKND
jgi:hypothetical protein